VLGTGIEDEAASVGRILGQIAAESARFGRPFPPPSVLIGCGGESTVRLGSDDRFGDGGPNREAALAAATRIAGLDVAAVFIDTDGSDGSGDVAGAIVDGDTLERSAAAPAGIRTALARHRSGEVVSALGDAIDTGHTHTNVNDLFAIAIGSPIGTGGETDER
jgi:hydroxypyruvate reductase